MRKVFIPAVAVAAIGFAGGVSAQTSTVSYEVKAISEMTLSGSPTAALVIDTKAELAGVSDATTTYDITTNGTAMKITGAIDALMPSDVTLKVALGAPPAATSAGATALTTTAADLVTGITELTATGLTVTYTLSALETAGAVAAGSRTVTYSVVQGV